MGGNYAIHQVIFSRQPLSMALSAWRADAEPLPSPPWLRWGRGPDNALYWDAGREDGQCVRVDGNGWTIVPEPAAWFRRSTALTETPLPTPGGSIDDLWQFANIAPADRTATIAWMLASMMPEREFAAGVLYLNGSSGAGKSTAATFICEAAGTHPGRHHITKNEQPKDISAVAYGNWTLLLDNLSYLSSEQSDFLCSLVTGLDAEYRTLFADSDTTLMSMRRPVVITSINLPVLAPDLANRMVPVSLHPFDVANPRRAETQLAKDFRTAQPAIFGAALTLLSQVMARNNVTLTDSDPRLGDMAILAHALDAILGTTGTAQQIADAQDELAAVAIGDEDVWFHELRHFVATSCHMSTEDSWSGTSGDLAHQMDPDGQQARQHGKEWPSAKAIKGRLDRNLPALTKEGWIVQTDSKGHKGTTWLLTPPPKADKDGTEPVEVF